MIYSINEGRIPMNSKKNIADIEAVYTEGTYITDCSMFITEAMVSECFNDVNIIRQTAILEGAKFDLFIKNWFKEGKDYKGLKGDLKQIIDANNLDESQLRSKGKGLLYICKRVLQVCCDLEAAMLPASGAIGIVSLLGLNAISGGTIAPALFIKYIIQLVGRFIYDRLFRYAVDLAEFNTIKKDAEACVKQLRDNAKKSNDEAMIKKYNEEADKLEKAIAKYSKKSDK